MLIPSIYACVFLGSMWDPYGNIGDLPVAVVNYDKSVDYNDKTLSIGDDLVDKLKDNDSLKFNFVDSDTAEQGIENGTYYMVITIPKDFSQNATTLMDANPKNAQFRNLLQKQLFKLNSQENQEYMLHNIFYLLLTLLK